MEQVEDKGPPKKIGKSNQKSKRKINAKKSCKIIGNELPMIGIIHAEQKCHFWTVVASGTGLSPVQGGNINPEIQEKKMKSKDSISHHLLFK